MAVFFPLPAEDRAGKNTPAKRQKNPTNHKHTQKITKKNKIVNDYGNSREKHRL